MIRASLNDRKFGGSQTIGLLPCTHLVVYHSSSLVVPTGQVNCLSMFELWESIGRVRAAVRAVPASPPQSPDSPCLIHLLHDTSHPRAQICCSWSYDDALSDACRISFVILSSLHINFDEASIFKLDHRYGNLEFVDQWSVHNKKLPVHS